MRPFYTIQKKWDPCKKSQAIKNGAAHKSLGKKVVKSKVAAEKWAQLQRC